MQLPLIVMIGLATPVALVYAAGRLLRRRYRLPTPADESHHAPTRDGWRIALHRYHPAATIDRPAREPVILCHGMLSNRFSVDLDERHSLARYLSRCGFDVWVMELRGHGASTRVGGGIRPFDWSIDEYVHEDLPAAIRYVQQATGADGVHWVGHSLGGMILYAANACGLTGSIRSAVFGDSPASFGDDRRPSWFGKTWARLMPTVPPRPFIPFVMVLAFISPRLLLPRYGIRNRLTMLRVVANGIIDVGCGRVARHLVRVVLRRRFTSADGSIDYEAGIERLDFPILQLAAARRRSPEAVVRGLIDRARVADRTYLRLGRREGFSEDYSHFTILLGENAPREVFPLIAGFLESRSQG